MFKIVHRLSNDETPSLSLVISEASRLSAPYDYLLIPNNRLLAKRKHSIGSVTLGMEIRKPAAAGRVGLHQGNNVPTAGESEEMRQDGSKI